MQISKPVANMKSYFAFKPQMLGHPAGNTTTVAYIRDPFGNSYGYSTANQTEVKCRDTIQLSICGALVDGLNDALTPPSGSKTGKLVILSEAQRSRRISY